MPCFILWVCHHETHDLCFTHLDTLHLYNPQKKSCNIWTSFRRNRYLLPYNAILRTFRVSSQCCNTDWWGVGKTILEVAAFFKFPLLHIFIHIKNTRLIWFIMRKVFQELFLRTVCGTPLIAHEQRTPTFWCKSNRKFPWCHEKIVEVYETYCTMREGGSCEKCRQESDF